MIISFLLWAMKSFNKADFAICGKTVQSVERNIIHIVNEIDILTASFTMKYKSSKHILEVSGFGHKNQFYVFGGKDESSYALIQGMTLSGVLFDEVALQVESFVLQAIARTLTVKQAKLFFNCNPEHPEHWFHKDWVLDSDGENKHNSYHLHFLMQDNPILDEEDIKKAEAQFSGVFRERYINGKWVVAEGLVYSNYDNTVNYREFYDPVHKKYYIMDENGEKYYGKYYLSIDYGVANPFSAGLWFVTQQSAVRLKEYYYDSRRVGRQKTNTEYVKDLKKFLKARPIEITVIDPSALSFINEWRQEGYAVRAADNNVIDGIRVADCFLTNKKVLINSKCEDAIREFGLYRWDEKQTQDKVLKEYDHAMDDFRYFCYTILRFIPQFTPYVTEIKQSKIIDEINKNWN